MFHIISYSIVHFGWYPFEEQKRFKQSIGPPKVRPKLFQKPLSQSLEVLHNAIYTQVCIYLGLPHCGLTWWLRR